ncbi:MAG: FliH/SctL family protein [Phycisphaerales bacterium]
MALMKEQNADRIAHEAIVLDLGDLRQQADRLKARARAEADQVLAAARAEAERLIAGGAEVGRRQGFEAGHMEGVAAGRKAGHAEALKQSAEKLSQLQQAFITVGAQWDAERRRMVLDAKQSVLELALVVAEKVVKRVPEVDATVVVEQVAAAVEHVIRPADLTIRVNPEDRPLVEEAMPQLTRTYAKLEHVKLADDAAIGRGGCVLTTGTGRVDATLETQLRRIVETLLPGSGNRVWEDAADKESGTPNPGRDGGREGRRDEVGEKRDEDTKESETA